MTATSNKTFKGLPVLRETTADKVNLPHILIFEGKWVEDGVDAQGLPVFKEVDGMEEYSGWGYLDHVKWVRDLTGLPIPAGSILATDEQCTEVWLLSNNHYKTKCRLIYQD